MKLEIVMACVLSFGAGYAVRDIAQPALADEREAALMDRELACKDQPGADALMVRHPSESDQDARCLLVKTAPSPRWWKFFSHPLGKKVAA